MEGRLEHELEVGVAASKVWEVFGSLKLAQLTPELLPDLVESVQVVEGDGGVGTVIQVVSRSGTHVPISSFKEKFTKLDEAKRIKHADMVEGGFLDLGFNSYRYCFEIIETGEKSSIIKSAIEYKAETAAIASLVSPKPLELLVGAVGKYIIDTNV